MGKDSAGKYLASDCTLELYSHTEEWIMVQNRITTPKELLAVGGKLLTRLHLKHGNRPAEWIK